MLSLVFHSPFARQGRDEATRGCTRKDVRHGNTEYGEGVIEYGGGNTEHGAGVIEYGEGATQNTEQGLLSTEKGQHRVRRRVCCVRDRSLRDHHWQMTERSKWAAMLGGLLVTRHAKCRKHAHGVMASASPSRAREAIRLQYNCTTSRITCTRFCQRHTR